ncbi:NAD-dependent epimerase/dehydratase family protein [Nocardia sp. SYP-A9097]|uniref:thioester reductase domain-containing protein n=1 Tax=Nocardia sp. SYP-A9097 TaxID=2663237 RepID=UPI00129BDB68|nr:thioester reductase domain-containing protein [Nocardia sp. SYP-A9097]MRH92368.1 NAD-dependent epimerase/dehydratase family protein [Nocardia sp. SYP-A9097]
MVISRQGGLDPIEREDGGRSVSALLERLRGRVEEVPAPPEAVPLARANAAAVQDAWTLDGLATAVTAIANRFTPPGALGPDTDFFDAGATSVDAVQLVATIARELDIDIDLDDVFADARPRQLARRWLAGNAPSLPVLDPIRPAESVPTAGDEELRQLMADIATADGLPFVGAPAHTAPRRILLTGATGFLGSHLLLDLLRHSDAHIVCLVRGEDTEAATQRLAAGLTRFGMRWSSEIDRRVTVLPGDIRHPRLGLPDERWNALAVDLDSIVNVAAAVDFLRGYSSLRSANVAGPLTLARLAVEGKVKPLHHISSIAVFNEIGIAAMGEDDPVAHLDGLKAGYDRTKWAAEAALRRAREHGVTVTLLRPGGIGGHTETGAHNPHDLSSALLASFSRFRTMPAFRHLNVAPVNWVSRIAAAIVCEPGAWGYNYHLTGVPRGLDEIRREMSLAGMHTRIQGWPQWRAETLNSIRAEPVPELEFLARMLESPTAQALCEASMSAPAATGERTRAFVRAHRLPEPAPYDARAQQKTFELLARDGLARLPHRDDAPYLWFPETILGSVHAGDGQRYPCALSLSLSIASMYQLTAERRVDVRGELTCPGIHAEPLTVLSGDLWIRPRDGVPLRAGLGRPLMRYRLLLRDARGQTWWLEGQKTARARRDLLRQARALTVEIGRTDHPAGFHGEVVVPADSYVPDQIDGIRFDPRLSERQRRIAKLIWLAWFGTQVGQGLLEPLTRAGAEVLELRADPERKALR